MERTQHLCTFLLLQRFLLAALVLVSSSTRCDFVAATEHNTAYIRLSNDEHLPLVGLGVGNLALQDLQVQVPAAVWSHGYTLIDTAAASRNEAAIAKALSTPPPTGRARHVDDVHVITKVWYTHLGYERTVLSVKESLHALDVGNNPHLQVHVLLHWPRCNDNISWMHCQDEEAALPTRVKEAGPPPHLDKETAFLESWRALEDLYKDNQAIASIGVSNFDLDDMLQLAAVSQVFPHILQINVWTALFDWRLMDYCRQHGIHVQVYNVMNGIVAQREKTPYAWEAVWSVAREVEDDHQLDTSTTHLTAAQILLKWLTQQGISVIPRTSKADRLQSQSPAAIAAIPMLKPGQMEVVERAVRALLQGKDLLQPVVIFVNQQSVALDIFWKRSDTGEAVKVKQGLEPGAMWETNTFPRHVFVVQDGNGNGRQELTVMASYGEQQQWVLEDIEEEEEL